MTRMNRRKNTSGTCALKRKYNLKNSNQHIYIAA